MSASEKKWTPEGIYLRRKFACIFPPKDDKYYKVRRIHSRKGSPLEKGEGNYLSRKQAFRAGNKLVRMMAWERFLRDLKG